MTGPGLLCCPPYPTPFPFPQMFSRRAFLKSSGLALAASGLGGVPTFLARAAQAAPTLGPHARRKTLVCVFQ